MDGESAPVNNRPGVGLVVSTGPAPDQSANYTIPGILNFVKHEWSRFERERASWEVEKAELQAKIAFLQGERKGHDNLMRDLVRRIKMLEYALKQERAKLYKLQHGTELSFGGSHLPEAIEPENHNVAMDLSTVTAQKEESRKILREYLREVGFPDSVLEARVARINAYKNLHSHIQADQLSLSESPKPLPPAPSTPAVSTPSPIPHPPLANGPIANGTDTQAQPQSLSSPSQNREASPPRMLEATQPPREESMQEGEPPVEGIMAEDRVMASFNFLDEEDSDEDEEEEEEEEEEEDEGPKWEDQSATSRFAQELLKGIDAEEGVELDMDTESTMDEFSSGNPDIQSGPEMPPNSEGSKAQDKQEDWQAEYTLEVQKYTQSKIKKKKGPISVRPSKNELQRMEQFKNQAEDQLPARSSPNQPFGFGIMRLPGRGRSRADSDLGLGPLSRGGVADERIEVSLLGDLAGLSISNESAGGFESPATEAKKWENKYTMRSHFDVVTSVAFHPSDHILVTGSEDCTLKIWNLQKVSQTKNRLAVVDVEPIHTFRGHTGAVHCVTVSINGDLCFSGGIDNTIRMWQLPGDLCDPFDTYDPEVHRGLLEGHTDAVWDLAMHPTNGLLLSCAADCTCRLWNPQLTNPEVKVFQAETGFGNPTSACFISTDLTQMVASFTTAKTVIYDLETGKPVTNLDSASTYDGTPNTQINKVVTHPTLPIIVTAHEDKYIRFYDANTGKVIHSMTAHTDAVTGLAVDPHGLYLLSGSHDGSLRFWNMDSKICIQETTAHRKRFDESICNVACHLTQPYFASAGADGIAKVFV